jgi:RHS repeat-associated protein
LNDNGNNFLYIENPLTWTNNGNLHARTIYAGGPAPSASLPQFSQTFTYDGVNRLTGASETQGATTWAQNYSYDSSGNVWMPSWTGLGAAMPNSDVFNASNQNPNMTYDAAGNQTVAFGGAMVLSYDGENRQAQMQTAGVVANYYYDGLGQRIAKQVTGGATTVYAYDAFGQLAAEYSSGATVTPACATCYLSYDHLGSPRLITDSGGNVVARHDYAPYGTEIPGGAFGRTAQWGASDGISQKFTGQMRDAETGATPLDFFNARYFSSGGGRFMSVDPGNAGADETMPQSWNGYAYVGGNPLALVDPSGMGSNYSGIQDGACPASQASCPLSGPPVVGAPSVPNELGAGEQNYINTVVRPGFLGIAPVFVNGGLPTGSTGATIYFGSVGNWLSTNLVHVTPQPMGSDDIPVGIDIWGGQQKLWSNTAGVGNALGAATAAVSALPVLIPAATATADAGGAALNRVLFGPLSNRFFWSGGTAAMLKAMELANEGGGSSLEMSLAGRALTGMKGFANPFWSVASRMFAQGAVGPVSVVQGPVLRITSTWGTVEYPQLIGKNPITYIGIGW